MQQVQHLENFTQRDSDFSCIIGLTALALSLLVAPFIRKKKKKKKKKKKLLIIYKFNIF